MSERGSEPSARGRLTEERVRAASRQRRQRLLLVVLGGVAIAAVAVVAVVVAVSRMGGGGALKDDYNGPLAPTAREGYGVAMARPGVTAPVLDLYEDFQCPACKVLEERVGGTIKQLAAEGKVKVVYRPFQLFQQEPLMSNSRRAANAAACLPAGEWVSYHDRLFAEQPVEGDTGFGNANLIKWAAELGVTGPAFAACVNGAQRIDLVEKASARAGSAGVDATPYLALNGRKLGDDVLGSPDELKEAVARATGERPAAPGGTGSTSTATKDDQAAS